MSDTPAALPPNGVKADLAHPTDVLRTVNFVTQALTLFFIPLFVCIRFVSKYRTNGPHFDVDDYLVSISCVLMIGYCICGIFLSVHGGGYHQWEVPVSHIVPFFKTGYAATIFYAPMALFVKLSLLSIIARVFSPYKKTVYGIYFLDGLLITYYVAALIIKIRICWPISAYWHGETEKCLDQAAVITADSVISMISDVVILILPLPLTWSLQLTTKKKLRVAGMLCIGGLATAFSAWRLHLILHDGKSSDQTMIFVLVVLSGNAEAGIGLICTCLPAVAALLHRMRGATGLGSSNSPQRSYQLSNFNSSRITKERGFTNLEAESGSLDEAMLVTNAQGHDGKDVPDHGIMRKVEVTHTVSTVSPRRDGSQTSKGFGG